MPRLEIYEPAAGCTTGACGPDAAMSQEAFEETLELLSSRGVEIHRFNLGHEPEAFSQNPTVKAALRSGGMASLPILMIDGQVWYQGAYPPHHELLAAASGGPAACAH
jgi:hypothetical protein